MRVALFLVVTNVSANMLWAPPALSPSLQVNGLNLGFGGIIDAYRELGLHARASDHLLKEIQVVEPVSARDVCDRERESEY
jgi:hypothetical protein